MRHVWKNGGDLKNVVDLQFWSIGAFGIMRHIWKNVAHLEKCDVLEKVWRIW